MPALTQGRAPPRPARGRLRAGSRSVVIFPSVVAANGAHGPRRGINRSAWKVDSANISRTEFSEAHLITFNTNIAHLGDALLTLKGVWCKCYVAW
jgi:hypothetical protein